MNNKVFKKRSETELIKFAKKHNLIICSIEIMCDGFTCARCSNNTIIYYDFSDHVVYYY